MRAGGSLLALAYPAIARGARRFFETLAELIECERPELPGDWSDDPYLAGILNDTSHSTPVTDEREAHHAF